MQSRSAGGVVCILVAVATHSAAAQRTISFTAIQAQDGRAVYVRACAACHGDDLDGATAVPLAGRDFQLKWSAPERSLYELLDVMRTTMPKGTPGSLASHEYVALLAYILERNGHRAGARPLVPDRTRLMHARLVRSAHADPTATAPAPRPAPRTLAPTTVGPTRDELRTAPSDGRNWLTHTRDYAGTRFSPLAQIDVANVSRLAPVCTYRPAGKASFQTGPVVYDGTMYVTIALSTIAIDASTCALKWRHDWTGLPGTPPMPARGVAVKDGRVIRATTDGHLLALDAATGALLWSRRVADMAKNEMLTLPPLIFEDLIFVGPAVGEFGVRGWVAAFRLSDGASVWRFNIVPERGEPGAETWTQDAKLPMGGGAVWTPLALDEARGILYVPAANPAPDFPAELRGGTNLYTNSVIALDARTGKLDWYAQLVPNDAHDWDLTQVSPLFRASINGAMRDAIATVGKDGVLRVLDRVSHERLFATAVTTIENANMPVTRQGVHACPGGLGGVQWNGPAYHPGANVLVVPAVDWCMFFQLADTVRFLPGQVYLGGTVRPDSAATGWLTAVDVSTGQVRWRYHSPRPLIGGVMATGGGLVFAGELTGDLVAFEVTTGIERARFATGGGVGGGVVSYEVSGRQYVAVASGAPSGYFVMGVVGPPTITVFALK